MRTDRRSSGWHRLLGLFLTLVLVAGACGDSGGGGDDGAGGGADGDGGDGGDGAEQVEPVRGGTLVYAVEGDTSAPWDPTKMLCAAACHSTVGRTVFEPLAMINEDGEAVPYLLESFEPNDDFTVWTLVLRDGIKFHDDTALDADAVAFNMERHRESALIGPAAAAIESVESDGARTVTVTMKTPWSDFPYFLNSQFGYVGSPTWEAAADEDDSLITKPVGTGPFAFASYEGGENGNFKADRFEGYWRGDGPDSVTDEGLPYLDGIEVRFLPSAESRSAGVVNGDIDVIQTSSSLELEDLADKDVTIDLLDDPFVTETGYLLVNHLEEVGGEPNPMSDLRVRQAVAHATDYDTYIALRTPDRLEATGPFPEGQPGYLSAEESGKLPFDLAKAKELVSDWEAENGDLVISYKTTTDPANLDTAELFKSMWEEAGMTVTLDQIPQGDFIAQAIAGNFQVFGWRLHAGVLDQQYVWWTTSNTSGLALNFGRIGCTTTTPACDVADGEVDRILDEARATTDADEKTALAEELNKHLNENVYNIWLNWTQWGLVHGNNVHNVDGLDLPGGDRATSMGANLPGVIMPGTIFKTG